MNANYMKSLHFVLLASALGACGVRSPEQSEVKEAWNSRNNPSILSEGYESKWSKLPLQAELKNKGWSDDYWATYKGGISYRWMTKDYGYQLANRSDINATGINNLSPAEKYDVFMDRLDFPTVRDERVRTKIMKTVDMDPSFDPEYKIPTWEGLCHGWAPAAHNFSEPKGVVKVKTRAGEMDFYPSDIKALLLYYQQYNGNRSSRSALVSGRCGVEFAELDKQLEAGTISKEDWTAARESDECRDVNPATFHLVISNEIGLKNKGFVVDVTRDFEVWNQPVNGYRTRVTADKKERGEGAAPETVRELTVETNMDYTVETDPSESRAGAVEETKFYEYILELNAKDEVIGGRWISEDRPDFMWRESVPEFRGYFAALRDLYEKGLKAD